MKYLVLITAAILLISCDPFGDLYSDIDAVYHYKAAHIEEADDNPDSLVVMTWNVKFGGGRIDFWFDCLGDRVIMTAGEVEDNLDGLVAYLNKQEIRPDILLLQEIDINSKRSAYIDQMQYLLDHVEHLNYGVYASQWQNQYVPSDGIGPIDSGNGILSRWPLKNAERIALDLRSEQDAVTQYFYLKRNILKTVLYRGILILTNFVIYLMEMLLSN